jgi:hypothetical protein
MCQTCVEIDKKIEPYRQVARSITDPVTIERINLLIAKLYGERVRLHQSD